MLRRIREVPEAPDVTIRLVRNRVAQEDEPKTLAVVKAHSKVLTTYSRYFSTCLSETWKGGKPSAGEFEQSLEVQADVESYFDCFSRMYSLFLGTFEFGLKDFPDVKSSLELLKVASQIQFDKLVGSVLLYLSSTFWDEGDEMRVREYSSSPDFRCSQAEDLVARLGLNESEEEHHKQLCDMLQHLIYTALHDDAVDSGLFWRYQNFITELLQRAAKPNATRSNFSRTVVTMLTGQARRMLVGLKEGSEKVDPLRRFSEDILRSFKTRVEAMCFLLKALLAVKLADEVVQYFVHLDAIPNYITEVSPKMDSGWFTWLELVELVLLIYQEVVAGHAPLRIPGRIALLANWHHFLKSMLPNGKLEELRMVTRPLFSTLPVKDQMEFIKARRWTGPRDFNDFISNESLILMLSKSCSWPAVWNPSADDTTTSSESSSKEGPELPMAG
jgi:hypothetical protein